jgi:hypothetical protein
MTGRHKLYADLLTEFSKPNFIPQKIRKDKKRDWLFVEFNKRYIKSK